MTKYHSRICGIIRIRYSVFWSVGAALVCEVDGQLVANPSSQDAERATLHLMVAGTKDAVLIEAGAQEVSEERIIEGIACAHKHSRICCASRIINCTTFKTKLTFTAPEVDAAVSKIESVMGNQIETIAIWK